MGRPIVQPSDQGNSRTAKQNSKYRTEKVQAKARRSMCSGDVVGEQAAEAGCNMRKFQGEGIR
jgi:hypothetical protein